MNGLTVILSQWQFAVTTIYHFFFVPLTLGLSVLVAIMETFYVRTGNQMYRRMTKFWGTLFLINFAMGVVTGIVQEFQFGMNWSEYSRYVGNIFGAPLAVEALLAFFLESTFLGVWIFGWDKLSKKLHLTAIWLVAIASNLSAFWILAANSFMQHPVGYVEGNGQLLLAKFSDLVTNPYVWGQFPHTILSGFTTGAFFVLGISAYHLLRKKEVELFKKSVQIAAIFGLIAVFGVALVGHNQAQKMVQYQPMKMAAAEGLVYTEDPASFSLFTIVDQNTLEEKVSIRIPYALSILAYNKPSGAVQGMKDIQAEFETKYGAGNYIPNIFIPYWSFRIMVGVGMLMLLLALVMVFLAYKKFPDTKLYHLVLKVLPLALFLPYVANSTGWLLTEIGRQPWLVYGLMTTSEGISPNLTPGMVWVSLIGFTLVYGLLMFADIYLLRKYAKAGPVPVDIKK